MPAPNASRRRLLSLMGSAMLAACAAPAPAPTRVPTSTPAPTQPDPVRPTVPAATRAPAPQLRAPSRAEPLTPLLIQVDPAGLTGAARLLITDRRGALTADLPLELGEALLEVELRPVGALGPQRGELLVAGQVVAVADPLFTLVTQTHLFTGQPRFDELYPQIRSFMLQGRLSYELDGMRLTGYRSPDNPLLWLRDHTYQARGFRYFERDMTSLVDGFRAAQFEDGSLPDWLANPQLGVIHPGRKPVEADVEFLFVQAAVEAWQVTGDDAWLRQSLDAMRQAIQHTTSDPLRWDAERGLIKRPYTIDMWDFSYGPTTIDPSNGQPAPRHWIDDQTIWGIFHGDNTGLAYALNLLAIAEEHLGSPLEALRRRADSDQVMERLEDLSWNGRFFTHFVPLQPFEPPGVDAAAQLSLSNTYALNREVLDSSRGRAIVEEYFRRGAERDPSIFAEWYSIDPPFPPGSYGLNGRPGEKPGEYVNGGIMPLVGGELARGAFRHGAERYAFEILHRYHFLVSTTGSSYLWYYPIGSPGISGVDTLATDGWGASAMLAALIEGAAGIQDRGVAYSHTRLAPRWAATDDVREVHAVAHYPASDGYAAYQWELGDRSMQLRFCGSGSVTELRLLLPEGVAQVARVTLDGAPLDAPIRDVFGSQYLTLEVASGSGLLWVEW